MTAPPVRVLLISGYSRSGSTLLARILGEMDGLIAPGELRYVWQRGLVENRLCDCGQPFTSCPFWQEVIAEGFGAAEALDVDRVLAEESRVDRFHRIPVLAAATHSERFREQTAILLSYYERLYQAIGEVSGARVIVDSSKDPSFGHLLAVSDRIDLSVVHLVRDSRAVAHSWTRDKHDPGTGRPMAQQSVARSGLQWTAANAAASWLNRRVVGSLRLRYEDLVSNPGGAVGQVLGLLGESGRLPLEGNRVLLNRGHTVSGNPLRFETGPLEIAEDDAWRIELPWWDRVVATGLSWPALLRYGYRGSTRSKL